MRNESEIAEPKGVNFPGSAGVPARISGGRGRPRSQMSYEPLCAASHSFGDRPVTVLKVRKKVDSLVNPASA